MPETATPLSEWTQDAIERFGVYMNSYMRNAQRYKDANEAAKALDAKYGYSARYGELGYVDYPKRDKEYQKISNIIMTEIDYVNESQNENMYKITEAIYQLPKEARKEIFEVYKKHVDKVAPTGIM